MNSYKNVVPHLDIDRSLNSFIYLSLDSVDLGNFSEFRWDIEEGNDSIELHLIRSNSYKEALVLKFKEPNMEWLPLLKEEQKTFGGSKIFYISENCDKLLLFSVSGEMKNKINMVITRLNKVNEKISRSNARIKKENIDIYTNKLKNRELIDQKEEILNFINQNLKV